MRAQIGIAEVNMPCGGIYDNCYGTPTPPDDCFSCKEFVKGGTGLFVDEWDAIIHPHCIGAFLQSPEGEILMGHKHPIFVPADFLLRQGEGDKLLICLDCGKGQCRANNLTVPFCSVPSCQCVCAG